MLNKHKYLPCFYYDSILDIPYDDFFKKNIKVLCFDLDNTLLSPIEQELNNNIITKLNDLKQNFKIVIISNAYFSKIRKILEPHNLSYIYLNIFHKKPSLWGLKQTLKLFQFSYDKVMMIGDQLRTDIASANKMNIISVLVKPLDRKFESLNTKLIRYVVEKRFINKIKKVDLLEYKAKFESFIK
ncbi:MAG: HAD hydrolase-like protein [Phytoplasma sp.]|uniref:YqeG family HAD IIIA-type phosphatase n=1 Tax=Phytoplasma sp. TaxID=2155 RepID=UPI002B40087C|nr:HAD family hydrolase [Phytoplasma sp.]WRH06761.1 MAG: HAD hydrolase-like protein [Phytoplasma sp.]